MGPIKLLKPKRKKVGLALGGGAARGLAHVGVLQVLEREGIQIDMIAGTSAGALIGGLYAYVGEASILKNLVIEAFSHRSTLLTLPAIPGSGLLQNKAIEARLRSIIGDVQFSELKIPVACVSTNIVTGEEIVSRGGPVVPGIMASINLPVLFQAIKHEEMYLVDGGLVDPVPVSLVREMGADFTIAVNVIPDIKRKSRLTPKPTEKEAKEPGIFQIMMNTIYVANYRLVRASLEEADVVIEPELEHIGAAEFRRVKECILQGELAAEAAIPEIRKKLGRET